MALETGRRRAMARVDCCPCFAMESLAAIQIITEARFLACLTGVHHDFNLVCFFLYFLLTFFSLPLACILADVRDEG